jgi:ADP-ribosylglycohydrolase
MKREKDQYLGCLLGLAVGDTLGAPVEFLSLSDIKRRYGGGWNSRFF